jgi:glycosyltransferase involved in cell wall biosynthesis
MGQDLVFVTVARLSEHKGHDDVLSAVGDSLRHNPTWKLLWVGDGWWRERLISRARGMGLGVYEADRGGGGAGDVGVDGGRPASVVVTGLVPSERVAEYLWASDVLVHPSLREGLPRTVPQGLLAGLAAVAYDVDGTGEACITGKTGVLVRAGDVAGLREAMVYLASDSQGRARLAAQGRAMCLDRFSAARMVAELERVYRGVRPGV